jgi:membrane protease YdiL (CAAX protease family)
LAIVLSALLFGIIHLDPTSGGAYTFYRVPFATVVGLGLGLLRVRSGSLTPCILAHAMLNTITFVTVLVTAPGTEPETANVLQAAAFFLLGGAASLFLLRLHARAPDA